MLNIKLTSCRECALVSKLIDSIDCQLAKMANNLYLNIVYMLDKPVEACTMSTLLHYKRILTFKSCNADWASDYSVDDIASRVNFLTVGCKCCNQHNSGELTTTTTTEAPVLITFYLLQLNQKLLTPFNDHTADGLPYEYTWQGSTQFDLVDDPAYTQSLLGEQTVNNDVIALLGSQAGVQSVSVVYSNDYDWANIDGDVYYKFTINFTELGSNTLEFTFRDQGHLAGGEYNYRYTITLENDDTVTTKFEYNRGDLVTYEVVPATSQFYDKDLNEIGNDNNTPIANFIE